jgi:hypothetical protein
VISVLPERAPAAFLAALSSCQVDQGLVGDPVERAAVEATGWVCKQQTVTSQGPSKETNKVRTSERWRRSMPCVSAHTPGRLEPHWLCALWLWCVVR